jgi:hypothetical protein
MSDRKPEQSEHERERPLRVARHRQHLIDTLEKHDPFTGGMVSIGDCERLAQLLFALIYEAHGEQEARQIFARWSVPPGPAEQKELENLALLDRLEIMNPRSARRLAREIAREYGIEPESVLTRIKRLKRRYPGALTPKFELEAVRTELKRIAHKGGGDISAPQNVPGDNSQV